VSNTAHEVPETIAKFLPVFENATQPIPSWISTPVKQWTVLQVVVSQIYVFGFFPVSPVATNF